MLVTIRGKRIEWTIMEVSPLNLGGGEAFYSLFSRQFSLFTYILLEVSYLITKNKHGSFKQTHSNTPAVEGPKRLFQFLPRELSPLQQLHSLHLYGKGYIGQIKLIILFSCKRFLYKHNRFITARTRFPWG